MIGILDSGMGGLITARAFREEWPAEDIVYFGDTARAPYGNKSPKTIRDFAMDGAAFLQEQGAGLIVVACHTIAAVAGQHLAAAMGVPVVDGIVP
ncbi:MAG: glutamate racemase, partial [Thermodesulfobacteriota bacterium]|nr:glutamate racemase [Thermodesulfobacteriota bacterium]